MAKRIKLMSALIILAIIIVAVSAVIVVEGQSIDTVSGFSMSDSTESSITVKWNRTRRADGYRLYVKENDNKNYEKLLNIENGDNCKYTFDGIKALTKYDLKITAFRSFAGKEYESDMSKNIIAYSKPHSIALSAFSSDVKTLSMSWVSEEKVDGFEFEYSKDKNFADCKTEDIADSSQNTVAVENLNPKDIYYTRGRTYITVGEDKIYSDWSDVEKTEIRDNVQVANNIDPDKKMVALSFDDGPAFTDGGKNSTERILNVLEKYGARATFFMVGDRINKSNSHLLKKELEIGCELGNHTMKHTHYGSQVTASDIKDASDTIKKYSGQAPTIFRCPGGSLTSTIVKECKKEGMPIAYWSVDTEDWKSKDADKIYKAAMNGLYDGSIILMHDIYPTTAEAVEKLVPALIKKGYQIVTVSELIAAKSGKEPKAGQQYVDYNTINNNT